VRTASDDIGAALGPDALAAMRRYGLISQKRFEQALTRSPRWSYDYALSTLKGRFLAGEPQIAKSPIVAFYYARAVLKTKWPEPYSAEVEKVIRRLPEDRRRQYAALPDPEPEPVARTSSATLPALRHYVLLKLLHRHGLLTKRVMAACATNALAASTYMALFVPKGTRWPEAEPAIAQDAQKALAYARAAVQGRWPEAEPTIAESAASSYEYALSVLEGPFPAGEPTIARDSEYGYLYAFRVLDMNRGAAQEWAKNYLASTAASQKTGGSKTAAPTLDVAGGGVDLRRVVDALVRYDLLSRPMLSSISKNGPLAYRYAQSKGKPWPEAEPAIFADPESASDYAVFVLRRPCPEAEPSIAKRPYQSLLYAKDIIKGRWEPGEPAIFTDLEFSIDYAVEVVKGQAPRAIEEKILTADPYQLSRPQRVTDYIDSTWRALERVPDYWKTNVWVLGYMLERVDYQIHTALEPWLFLAWAGDRSGRGGADQITTYLARNYPDLLRAKAEPGERDRPDVPKLIDFCAQKAREQGLTADYMSQFVPDANWDDDPSRWSFALRPAADSFYAKVGWERDTA